MAKQTEFKQYSATKVVPIAAQVCLNCKSRKRKCNKALPKCELCTRLLLNCTYGNTVTAVDLGNNSKTLNGWMKTDRASTEGWSGKASPTFLAFFSTSYLTVLSDPDASRALHAATTNEVLRTIALTGGSVHSVIATHQRCIGAWLKCISYERLTTRVETMHSNPSSDLAVLILVLNLVVQMPGDESMQSPAYFAVKAFLDPILSSGRATLEIVQASLLVALYEHGHGLIEVAQITMAACGRLGMKVMACKRRMQIADLQNTEEGRLWWCIIIIDRYMSAGLAGDEINFAAGPSNHRLFNLPLPMEEQDQPSDPSLNIEYFCGPTNGPRKLLTPFVASSIAAYLLGQVLETRELRDEAAFTRLDRAMQALAMDLVRQAGEVCAKSCAAIAMNLIGLSLLHKARYEWMREEEGDLHLDLNSQTAVSITAIKAIVRISMDIIERFNHRMPHIQLNSFPIPAAYAAYAAALAHIEFAGNDFESQEWNDGIILIKKGLENFGLRWSIAQRYTEDVTARLAAKRLQYSNHRELEWNHRGLPSSPEALKFLKRRMLV